MSKAKKMNRVIRSALELWGLPLDGPIWATMVDANGSEMPVARRRAEYRRLGEWDSAGEISLEGLPCGIGGARLALCSSPHGPVKYVVADRSYDLLPGGIVAVSDVRFRLG